MRRLQKHTRGKALTLCPMIRYDEWEPLVIKWNMRRPPDKDIHKWRRIQLTRFLDKYPSKKPKQVLAQINSHSQNPQPDCSTKELSRLLREIQKTQTYPSMVIRTKLNISLATKTQIEPKLLKWNTKKPYYLDVRVWCRYQVQQYIEHFPNHKPRKVIE